MNITPDMAWLRSRDEDGHLPPPPADVDVGKLWRNGWCREVDGGWVVTESAAWALGIGEERVRQEIEVMPNWRSSSACQADSDGECDWRKCPQLRDNEPYHSGRHCPLDLISPETHTPDEAKAAIKQILDLADRRERKGKK